MKKHPDTMASDFPLLDKARYWRAALDCGYRIPKKLEREIVRAAAEWLPYRVWGDIHEVDAPYGEYHVLFAVELEMERRWRHNEFLEGMKSGLSPSDKGRDENPYFGDRYTSWDCGYILGLEYRKNAQGESRADSAAPPHGKTL